MKVKTLSVLAGLGGAMILSSAANAAYTGLEAVLSNSFFDTHPNAGVQAAWLAGPNTQYYVVRLYANFDSNTAADRVNAVAGTPTSPLLITSLAGNFHNFDDGYGPYNIPSFAPVDRAWDTWVTIGNAVNGGATGLTPGFDTETGNLGTGSSVIGPSTNVAWFVTPADAQGQAVATAQAQAPAPPGVFRVLLGQFVVSQSPIAGVVGSALINVNGQDMLNQTFEWIVPAPGALALLGVAGLVGARRRRG